LDSGVFVVSTPRVRLFSGLLARIMHRGLADVV
jgi:hypothetical protein